MGEEFLCQKEEEESEVQSSSIEEDLEVDSEVEKPNTEESEDPHSSGGMEVNIEKTSSEMHTTGLMVLCQTLMIVCLKEGERE